MAKPKVAKFEFDFARSILKYAKGNVNNTYLLLAIIAWVRKESGQKYIGNNPLNLRPGGDIAAFMSGKRKGPVGYFATFKNLDMAARATIARLTKVGSWAGYKPVLAALKRGGDPARQGYDFLLAVAKSKWSATRYGYKPATEGHWVTRELPNGSKETIWVAGTAEKPPKKLIEIWQSLLGTALPDSWFQVKTTTVKRRVIPRQPRSLEHVLPEREYIQPYATTSFYNARPHIGAYVLQQDDDLLH